VVGQVPCEADLGFFGQDLPLVNGYAVDITINNLRPKDGVGCLDCNFDWDIEVEITTPVPMLPGNLLLCAWAPPSGTLSCGDPGSSVSQPIGGPPFVYTFQSVAVNFRVPCGGRLALSLEWNPGLGYITLVELVLRCIKNGNC
jgi:hypothetical protein